MCLFTKFEILAPAVYYSRNNEKWATHTHNRIIMTITEHVLLFYKILIKLFLLHIFGKRCTVLVAHRI